MGEDDNAPQVEEALGPYQLIKMRLSSPIAGSFAVSYLLWGWQFVYTLVKGAGTTSETIDEALSYVTSDVVIGGAVSGLAYLVFEPILRTQAYLRFQNMVAGWEQQRAIDRENRVRERKERGKLLTAEKWQQTDEYKSLVKKLGASEAAFKNAIAQYNPGSNAPPALADHTTSASYIIVRTMRSPEPGRFYHFDDDKGTPWGNVVIEQLHSPIDESRTAFVVAVVPSGEGSRIVWAVKPGGVFRWSESMPRKLLVASPSGSVGPADSIGPSGTTAYLLQEPEHKQWGRVYVGEVSRGIVSPS